MKLDDVLDDDEELWFNPGLLPTCIPTPVDGNLWWLCVTSERERALSVLFTIADVGCSCCMGDCPWSNPFGKGGYAAALEEVLVIWFPLLYNTCWMVVTG